MEMSKEMLWLKDSNFRWMPPSFLASVDVMEFHTFEAYSSLGQTTVKYTTNKLSLVEKE